MTQTARERQREGEPVEPWSGGSVGLLPGAQVQLEGEEGVPVPQAGVEHVKVGPPHLLQVVLQHHLHTTEEELCQVCLCAVSVLLELPFSTMN